MGGIYSPHKILPVGSWKGLKCPSSRPTNDHIFDRWAHRSTGSVDRDWIQRAELSAGRPTRSTGAIPREQSSLDGRPTRSTGPPAQAGVHACARRSIAPVDRLLLRSTGPVDRQTASLAIIGLKNLGFYYQINPIKSHKFHKNQFLLYLWNTKMCDNNSTHISNYLNHFCEIENLLKPKTVFSETWIFENGNPIFSKHM